MQPYLCKFVKVWCGAIFAVSLCFARPDTDSPGSGLRRGQDDPPSVAPTAPARDPKVPISSANSLKPGPGRLVREGAFLRERRGRAVRIEGDQWAFIFDRDAAGNAEPPMQLQPCTTTEEIQRVAESSSITPTFEVAGQVLVFEGRNFLLPRFFRVVSIDEQLSGDARASQGDPAPSAAGTGGPEGGSNPSAADLLRGVGADAPPPPTPAPSRSNERVQTPRQASRRNEGLLREGVTLAGIRGRVEQRANEIYVFTPDNNPNGKIDTPPSLVLLPCLQLQEISALVRSSGDRLPLMISGQVFLFMGRNYLLPTMFWADVDREGNLAGSP